MTAPQRPLTVAQIRGDLAYRRRVRGMLPSRTALRELALADAEAARFLLERVDRLGAAATAVRALHSPVVIYPVLDLPGSPPDTDAAPRAVLCGECTPAGVLANVESATWFPGATDVPWPCRTLLVLGEPDEGDVN